MMRASRRSGYSITEAAAILQFHPDTLRYWVRIGELPGKQDERRGGWLIEPEDLVAFLRRNGEEFPVSVPLAS